MPQCIRIHPADNVAVALCPIPAGTRLSLEGRAVQMREDIPQGHKLALAQIAAGENIIKYGYPIGHAASDIPPGAWVHTHNVRTNLSGEVEYTYAPDVRPLSPVPPETFQGYRRADGRVGVRNELWIIPTVGCVNDCAKALAVCISPSLRLFPDRSRPCPNAPPSGRAGAPSQCRRRAGTVTGVRKSDP